MAYHSGLCIIEIARFRKAAGRFGGRFLARLFTRAELAYGAEGAVGWQRLAARFAAKAAVRQALRAAGMKPPPWRACEITRDEWGQPAVALAPPGRVLLSLTHSRTLAAGSATACGVQQGGEGD